MNIALFTVALAIGWAAATGSFTLANLLFGALIGGACLFVIRDRLGGLVIWPRVKRFAALLVLFVKELFLSAIRVALLVVRPDVGRIRPAIVAFPLSVTSDAEITMLANLITLTPGTLSVDVSEDRRFLYIHAIDLADRQALIDDIRTGFERRVMEAMR